ncbi:armadillo-type protein [Globomyces pollinis-pini]|nr:armadillo-type protein [Globomyces pollinis-pini]
MATIQEFYGVLTEATSLDTEKRTHALNLLGQWEKTPTFHSTLQQIYLDVTLATKVRSLAIIILKNNINKYWRRTENYAIGAEEKAQLRTNQLSFFAEESRQLASLQAVVTSKIARYDFPQQWPNLLDVLIPTVEISFSQPQNYSLAIRYNSLYTLHLVMKTLGTKTLPSARKLTQVITPNVFKFVSGIFKTQLELFFNMNSNITSDPTYLNEMNNVLSLVRVALKCLRRLLINGYQRFSQATEPVELLTKLIEFLPRFLSLREKFDPSSALFKTISSLSLLIGKIYLDVSLERVVDFVVLPSFIGIIKSYWSLLEATHFKTDDPFIEAIRIQSIKMMKNVVKHRDFSVIKSKNPDPLMQNALHILENLLFTPDFVLNAAKLLISRYLILTNSDLETWADDPESFVQDEDSDHWEYQIRGSSEKLLMLLISKNKELLCPFLIETLVGLPELSGESIIFQEAVYCSIGLGASDLYDYLDFDDWMLKRLLGESERKHDDLKIIRKRIANLLGQWVSVKCSKESRPFVYQILLSLLHSNEDIVVRLTAVNSLKLAVDDFDFELERFNPFFQPFVDGIMVLLKDVEDFDSKMKIINCLIVMIERMDGNIYQSIQPLVQLLPNLWDASEGQNMFRVSIVTVIAKLVKTYRTESYQLHEIVVSVLSQSLDITKPGHVYLLEEGLELWLVTMQNCPPEYAARLFDLFPIGISLLEFGTDSMKRVLHILEAYIVLSPSMSLQNFSIPIVTSLTTMLTNASAVASNHLLKFLEVVLQASYQAKCYPAVFQIILSQGLFSKLMSTVLIGDELSIVIVGILMVLCRMIVYDADSMVEAIATGGPNVLDQFVTLLLDKYDAMGHFKQRKLCALALSALIGTGIPVIVGKLDGTFAIFTSIVIEINDPDKPECLLLTFDTRDEDEDENSLDYQRRQYLKSMDPLYMENTLVPFLKAKLGECEQKIGGENMNKIMTQIDPDILNQMKRIIG